MLDTIPALAPLADVSSKAADERQFRADVLHGLRAPKKELPCKYFDDEVGSALFEQITELEEVLPDPHRAWHHGAARGGDGRDAGAALPAHRVCSGSSLSRPGTSSTGCATQPVTCPSTSRASTCSLGLRAGMRSTRTLGCCPLCRLHAALDLPVCRKAAARRVVYFPGSTLGNFTLGPRLCLSALNGGAVWQWRRTPARHRFRKEPNVIEAAYNDRRGVTPRSTATYWFGSIANWAPTSTSGNSPTGLSTTPPRGESKCTSSAAATRLFVRRHAVLLRRWANRSTP